ncbi:MAG: protease [Phycisphaerales bacterium]|nr:protease [Phycisphaerales bacterium]
MRHLICLLMTITIAGSFASAAITTAPAATTTSTAPALDASAEKFPTPAELIEKMRAAKAAKNALPHVAYISINEPIVEKPADFSFFGDPDAPTLRSLLDRLSQAKFDSKVRAVLITLGGDADLSFSQAQEIRDALQEINRAGKKTFVYADAYDTPRYTLASGATKICLLEGGEILIPGVGMEAMFAKGLLDKVGVKADYIQIGEYKGADEQFTRTTASDQLKGEMNRLADSLYEQIVDGISLHRNLPKTAVQEIIDDAILNGRAAKEKKLVDVLIDQDGLRKLIESEIAPTGNGNGKKIELVHDYGSPKTEAPDFSNPFALLAAMAKGQQQNDNSGKPQIGLVYVDGVITDGEGGESMFGNQKSAGSEDLRKALRMAAKDDNVKAVVIRIDSPGGSALASEVIWQSARRVAEKKPVVVSIGGMAASGGYYIASAADTIYADSGAIVGSIGVVGGKFVYTDLLTEKLGVTTESFSKGRNADLFSSNKIFDERQRKMVTGWMKETYEQFLNRIQTTRRSKIKHIDDVARGRIFAAKQGKDLGLVDEIGGLEDAIADAAGKAGLSDGGYDVRSLPQPKTLADIFGGGGGQDSSDSRTPFQPKIKIDVNAFLGLLDAPTRKLVQQQLTTMTLFQKHPVNLVAPYSIRVK